MPPSALDLALVLAIDTSGSISNERLAMQINGYAQAFREADLVRAVQTGTHRRIAVTFVMWSDYDRQYQAVPWTIITDRTSAVGFADSIMHGLAPTPGWTSISGAIRYSTTLFGLEPAADRRVIDISGDGSNNDGPPPQEARDAAVSQGITINGLPILEVEPDLDRYYRRDVIGGPSAFLVVAHDRGSFETAVLRKLLAEVAGTQETHTVG